MSKHRRNEGTHWWVWVQFVVLMISLVANVVLWLGHRHFEAKERFSTYNDLAWQTLHLLETRSVLVISQMDSLAAQLAGQNPTRADWFHDVCALDSAWVHDIKRLITEAESKLQSYRNIVEADLDAMDFVRPTVTRITPPSQQLDLPTFARALEVRNMIRLFELGTRGHSITTGLKEKADRTRELAAIADSVQILSERSQSQIQKVLDNL